MGSLVFLDVDGTLLNEEQSVPDSARQACIRAKELGHVLFMCTGRCGPEIYPWLWDLGFSGLVATNGSYGVQGETVLFDHRLDASDIERLTEFLIAAEADWAWQTPHALHPTDGFMRAFEDSVSGLETGVAGHWGPYLERVRPFLRADRPDSASKLAFSLPPSLEHTAKTLTDLFDGQYVIVPGSVGAGTLVPFELVARGVSKGAGLREVADHLAVPLDQTVAVGDSANDVSMLEVAGLSIAMGNGTKVAKAAADWVTSSVDEDGLARALEYAKLI